MATQQEKAAAFKALHASAFIIPNPYDAGTARLLAALGFKALATTSAGCAFGLGLRDNSIDRDTAMAHVASIAQATELPVSGDLENGFDDSAAEAATTIRLAARAGLVGGSIEDASGRKDAPIYDLSLAVERVAAAAAAAREQPFDFTLTARAENYLCGRQDLKDTIKRLQAYQEAGADVLYAPGLTRIQDIASVVRSVDRPLNVVMGLKGSPLTLSQLAAVGVKRVSVGSALSRAALGAFMRAAQEMRDHGSFNFAEQALAYQDINAQFAALSESSSFLSRAP